jgi:hypothetical protein
VSTSVAACHNADDRDRYAWTIKTADQILKDVNDALTGMYVDSLQIEFADTLLLPVQALALIATKRLNDLSSMTVSAVPAAEQRLLVPDGSPPHDPIASRPGDGGAGDTGRLIAYRRDPQVIKMHIPMTHRFLPVWQTGPLGVRRPRHLPSRWSRNQAPGRGPLAYVPRRGEGVPRRTRSYPRTQS